jgi:hypothetical protein
MLAVQRAVWFPLNTNCFLLTHQKVVKKKNLVNNGSFSEKASSRQAYGDNDERYAS